MQRVRERVPPGRTMQSRLADPGYQAFLLLWIGFTVAPILAGLDKFFNVMVDWHQYLAPQIENLLPVSGESFMLYVGAIEIAAGVGVALWPRFFGYVVSAWLVGIIFNLLVGGEYYDIALRDLGLAIGAFALARLALVHHRARVRF